jgi:hypothetical protein
MVSGSDEGFQPRTLLRVFLGCMWNPKPGDNYNTLFLCQPTGSISEARKVHYLLYSIERVTQLGKMKDQSQIERGSRTGLRHRFLP